jgi:hypothetical protein
MEQIFLVGRALLTPAVYIANQFGRPVTTSSIIAKLRDTDAAARAHA